MAILLASFLAGCLGDPPPKLTIINGSGVNIAVRPVTRLRPYVRSGLTLPLRPGEQERVVLRRERLWIEAGGCYYAYDPPDAYVSPGASGLSYSVGAQNLARLLPDLKVYVWKAFAAELPPLDRLIAEQPVGWPLAPAEVACG